MKSRIILFASLVGIAIAMSLAPSAALASVGTCTPTGFYVDGMNLTAAEINPGSISGPVNAAGCNIGVYYDDGTDGGTVVGGTVNDVTISGLYVAGTSGANYFGILVNGGGGHAAVVVNITNSTVENTGENPLNGTQHGDAIFFINGSTSNLADDSRTCSSVGTTTGIISGDTVGGYQKNGITAKCPGVSVTITGNTVTGAGAVNYIAQNGIELGLGAGGSVNDNTVSENEYTGDNNADSSGILVFGGTDNGGALSVGVKVTGNTLTDNDVGIFSVNSPAPTATNNKIHGNTLNNPDVSNVSGCGHYCSTENTVACSTDADCSSVSGTCIEQGYQAGISQVGNSDQITGNPNSGAGYATNGHVCGDGSSIAILAIDSSGTNNKVQGNHFSP